MRLRKLEYKDAQFMLEWMHDTSVVENLQINFAAKTIKDCQDFIEKASNTTHNLHLAVVNDDDTYMGTVSLKHITKETAEFAITVRKEAMGQGYSKYGMFKIIEIGFEKLGLNQIYWYVSPKNKRAIRFYDRNGYQQIPVTSLNLVNKYSMEQLQNYIWYQQIRKESLLNQYHV